MGKTGGEDMTEPRPYRDQHDQDSMRSLLVRGRKANNGSYYIHTGDLSWWLYYPPLEGDYWKDIFLWDDPEQPGQILGWALINTDWVGFDVYVQPELFGTSMAQEMYVWAEQKALEIARERGRKTTYVLWIRHDDAVLGQHLRQQGYRLARGMVHLTRNLDDAIPPAKVSGEFTVRTCKGEPEVAARARAQYGAFGSDAPFELYFERFRKFMRSPAYDPSMDIVAVAVDGQIGAFCIGWLDPVNQVGLFEPVGTHPDFQRMGLGRAVMLEGMHKLSEAGMKQAIVSTFEDNEAAIKLYQSMCFQIVYQLGTYEKDV
jgi:mycothiol synthase